METKMMKAAQTAVLCGGLALGFVSHLAAAEETPRWIGLDTALRDRLEWAAPASTPFAASLDTRIADFVASAGRTVRGSYAGAVFYVR